MNAVTVTVWQLLQLNIEDAIANRSGFSPFELWSH
jgi:hypothetical protein